MLKDHLKPLLITIASGYLALALTWCCAHILLYGFDFIIEKSTQLTTWPPLLLSFVSLMAIATLFIFTIVPFIAIIAYLINRTFNHKEGV